MVLLVYSHQEKSRDFELPLEKGIVTCLKVNSDRVWDYTIGGDMQECPTQVVRASNGFYVLIVQRTSDVSVNGIKVFGLRVLRNADNIQVGQEEIRFYEWVRQEITNDSKLSGINCPFCAIPFMIGVRVMLCPKCDTPLHDYCWDSRRGPNEGCVSPNCGYVVPQEDPYVRSSVDQN